MPDRLATILDELHAELESAQDLDDASRDALRAAAAEIKESLDVDRGSQLDALRERIEGSHPRITEVLRRLVDQLAEMGI
jgi:hypothetical protein